MKNSETYSVVTQGECEVVVTRVVDAPRNLVWEAWTDPKLLPRWMLGPPGWTMPVCEIDLRVGGKWHFVWRQANGNEMAMTGTYREIIPPSRLVTTESWGGDWPETTNTLVLTEKDGRTTIAVTMLYPSKEAREAALKTNIEQGMAMTYNRLDEFLASHGG